VGYATLYISSPYLMADTHFTIWVYSDLPYQSFTICATPGTWCQPNYGALNSNGDWMMTLTASSDDIGSFGEYITVPGWAGQSNTINITVSPFEGYANYYISSSDMQVGTWFLVWVSSNEYDQPFQVCVDGTWCEDYGQTDGNGTWSSYQQVTAGSVGTWEEWLVFPDGTWSDAIWFTVYD
jgi:hypothetical protein